MSASDDLGDAYAAAQAEVNKLADSRSWPDDYRQMALDDVDAAYSGAWGWGWDQLVVYNVLPDANTASDRTVAVAAFWNAVYAASLTWPDELDNVDKLRGVFAGYAHQVADTQARLEDQSLSGQLAGAVAKSAADLKKAGDTATSTPVLVAIGLLALVVVVVVVKR